MFLPLRQSCAVIFCIEHDEWAVLFELTRGALNRSEVLVIDVFHFTMYIGKRGFIQYASLSELVLFCSLFLVIFVHVTVTGHVIGFAV